MLFTGWKATLVFLRSGSTSLALKYPSMQQGINTSIRDRDKSPIHCYACSLKKGNPCFSHVSRLGNVFMVKLLRKCMFVASILIKFSWGSLPDPPLEIGLCLWHSVIHFWRKHWPPKSILLKETKVVGCIFIISTWTYWGRFVGKAGECGLTSKCNKSFLLRFRS
jgi:hypothetical protein